jgi:hypothetical protein
MNTEPTQPVYCLVPGYPAYRVGTDGSVWSRWGRPDPRGRAMSDVWTRLRPHTNADGYRRVNLCRPGERPRTFMVHTLVLLAFVGPKPAGLQARHLRGAAAGDSLDNLAWGTHPENQADIARHGTRPRGETHPRSKLSAAQVADIRRRYAAGGVRMRDLAAEYGVNVPTVSMIVSGRTWRDSGGGAGHD